MKNYTLKWWMLILPGLLLFIYSFLSYLAFADQGFFFESMQMPKPNHDFLIWSWGGKNTAIVVGLAIAIISRQAQMLWLMLAVLFTMQWGDVNAGTRTGVDVFVTYLAMGLTLLQAGLMWWQGRV